MTEGERHLEPPWCAAAPVRAGVITERAFQAFPLFHRLRQIVVPAEQLDRARELIAGMSAAQDEAGER